MKLSDFNVDVVTGYYQIDEDTLEELIEDSNVLQALVASGVDNWEGYDEALEALEE